MVQQYDGKDYAFEPGDSVVGVLDFVAADFERLAAKWGVVAVAVPANASKADRTEILNERRLYALGRMRTYAEELLHDARCVIDDHKAKGRTVHRRDDHVEAREKRLEEIDTLIEKAPKPKRKVSTESVVEGARAPDVPSLADIGRHAPHPGHAELVSLGG